MLNYDVYQLLENDRIQNFIGIEQYFAHKDKRFRVMDEKNLTLNPAFSIPENTVRDLYTREYEQKSALYYGRQPKFQEIIEKIGIYIPLL